MTLVMQDGIRAAGLEKILKYKSEESFPSLQPDGVIVQGEDEVSPCWLT